MIYRRKISIIVSFLLIFKIFSTVISANPEILRIGFWGTWKVPCGIAMYTDHIYNALKNLGYEVHAYGYQFEAEELLDMLIKDNINVLNVQYEVGIMPEACKLVRLFFKLKSRGIKIVVTVHDEPKFINEFYDSVDQFIYHKNPIYLKKRDKVNILPMGVPVFKPSDTRPNLRKKYGFSDDHKIIVTSGFMLHTKEISKVLEEMVIYIKSNPKYRLQLLNSFTPRNHLCTIEYNKIRSIISKYKLDDQVIHISTFLPQQELSERIWISDIGYQWFNEDTAATSAASKEYIAAKLPLIVPAYSHFHDLKLGVIKTPKDIKVFVKTIFNYINRSTVLKNLECMLELQYNNLNYNELIYKYIEIYSK